MKKISVVLLTAFFLSALGVTISFTAEKPCSQYNYWTENFKYKKCMAKIKKEKGENFFSKINKKYKSLREKVPETGSEAWKEYKKNKQ